MGRYIFLPPAHSFYQTEGHLFAHISSPESIPPPWTFFFAFVYFWLYWVVIAARRLSLAAASRGYSLVVRGLLVVVASLLAEHRL